MASAGEGSRIPSAVSGKDKRRSFLPGPKTLSSKPSSSTGAEKPQARPSFRVGEQVVISGVKRGRLRYLGPAHFAEGEWCGIELDEPDGNHDGVVEGKRYFACIPNHGIFAPSQKVELVKSAQNGTSDSGIKREASPASTGSRLKQPKTSGLVQPQTRTRSKSPEVSRKSPESKEASKFQSKLVRPKSIPKPRTVSVGVLSSSSDTDTEKSGKENGIKKPSKLPLGGKSGKKGYGKDTKLRQSGIPGKQRGQRKESKVQKKGLNSTYTKEELKKVDEYDGDLLNDEIKVTTPSRVDSLTAFTLAYDLENSGSDSDNRRGLNLTFDITRKKGNLLSPIPDVLTPPAYFTRPQPIVDLGGEAMSEPEDNYDILTASAVSHASSLGILADSQICDNSLITDELAAALRRRHDLDAKESTELMEKDLDFEISGISTPDIDMSSSTLSGKDGSSSPEPENKLADLTFDPVKSSTPNTKGNDTEAGEKLASPESGKSGSSPEHETEGVANLTYEVRNANEEEPMDIDADDEGEEDEKPRNVNKTFRVGHKSAAEADSESSSGASSKRSSFNKDMLDELEQYPKGMRTSVDLDEVDVSSMNASVELARTAVQQYAQLMRGAENERAKAETKEAERRVRRMTPGSSVERMSQASSLASSTEALTSKDVPEDQEERDQLLQDLQAGHIKHQQQRERPVSIISTGSADTGIVPDLTTPTSLNTPENRRERPLSLISTSSIDTGYQPDGDDIVEISPETDEAPVAPPLEQDTTVQENTVQDSALQDTAVQNTTVQNDTVQETTVQENSVQDSALQGGTMEESALQETVLHREEAQSTEQPGKDTEVKETQVSAQPDTGKTRDTGKNRDLAETRDETEVRVEAETRDMAGTRDAVETRDMAETTPAESRSEPQVGETVMVNHIQSLDEDLSSDTSSHQRADDSLGESSNEDITVCEFREKSSSTEVDTESPKEETKRTEMEKEQTDEPHSPQEEQAPPLLHEESVVEEEVEEERVEPVESMQVLAEPVPVLEMKEIDVRPQEDFVAVQEQKEHAPSAEKFDIIQKEKEDEMSSSTRKDAGNEKEEKLAEEEIKEKTNESVENDKEEPIKVDPNIQEEKVNEIMQKREEEGEMSSSTMKDAGSEKCKSAEEFKESEVGVHTIEVHGEMSDEMRKLGECSMMENYIVPVERLPMVETEEKDLPGDHGVERKVEMMTMVEVAVVDEAMTDSDMSESTVKDLGFGEIGLKDIEEEPETPTHVEELEKDEKKEEETEVDQLEKEKDKKVKEKTVQKDVKGLKSKGVNNKSNTEKIDKTPLKGKQIKAKTVGKKDSPDKIDTKKPNTKVTSKVGSLINKPNTAKGKDLDNSKLSKNAANKKKSDLGINAKNTTITVGVVTARQRRASAPAPKIDLNASARSVGARSVISDISEDTSKTTKSLKREKPKSKWDNIMNKIETSKKDPKPKPDVKSKIGDQRRASLNPSALPSQQNRTPISTRKTSVVDTNKKSTLRPASAAKSMRPGTAPSPEASRPGSRVSSASDVSARSTRPTSAKPQNRTTGALRKERSPSAGSESATSVISVCSSQGSKPSQSSKSARTSPRESTPERLKAASRMGKRNSTTAIEKPATKSTLAEKRRASVATSRLAPKTSKDSVDGQKSSTLKKPLGKDANRSKTATRGTPSSASKRNPPDVVATSATGKAAAAAEISRLEALCEARTKELNYTKLQLKSRLQGFEAMTVLVKYLTEELNAFSCPEVTEKLIKCQEDLAKAQTQLGELEKAKDVLEVEIGKMKEEHTQEVLDLKTEHAMKVTSAEERLKREAQKEAQRVIDKHYHEIKTLKAFHEKHIVELKTDHERELLMKQEDQLEEISRLQSQQEERLVELQHQHQMKLEEITMRFDHIKVSLHEKVEFLRKEGEEMRMREQHYIQQCQLDSDMKVQRAIAPFQHLPAEIESLKAVMEMRNQEIHDLRRQKVDMEKELDELPPARDRILNLQQKVENLEAIIDIKAEYERQLAEKHTLLLRKFDRESKANKRLSMEAEELTWRLTQQEAQVLGMGGSPDLVRRQISRSPPTTPDPLRRKKSPTARSPTAKSPRHSTSSGSTSSSGDFMTMSNTSLMSNSGSDFLTPLTPNGPSVGENSKTVPLRRSGTYDLLQKDCENETELKKANDQLMKQSDV